MAKGAGNYKRTNLSNTTVGAASAAMHLSFAAKAAPTTGMFVISGSLRCLTNNKNGDTVKYVRRRTDSTE